MASNDAYTPSKQADPSYYDYDYVSGRTEDRSGEAFSISPNTAYASAGRTDADGTGAMDETGLYEVV